MIVGFAQAQKAAQGLSPGGYPSIGFGDVWAIDQFMTKSWLKSTYANVCPEDSDTLLALVSFAIRHHHSAQEPQEFFDSSAARLLYPNAHVDNESNCAFLRKLGTAETFEKFVNLYLEWCIEFMSAEDLGGTCVLLKMAGAKFASFLGKASQNGGGTEGGHYVISLMAAFFLMEFEKQLQHCGSDKVSNMSPKAVLDEFAKTKAKVIGNALHREEFTSLASDVIEATGMKIPASFKVAGNRVEVGECSFNHKSMVSYKLERYFPKMF